MLGSRAASPSQDRLEDKRALLEAFDGFSALRNGLRRVAEDRGDWAGIPMPLEGQRLVIEPRYPMAAELSAMGGSKKKDEEPEPADVKIRNQWWSDRLRAEIFIWDEGGKLQWGKIGRPHHIALDMQTLGCMDAWGIEQESSAVQLLASLLSHRQLKQYLLTGMFLETSKRSKLTYLFRRLKPTLVLDCKDPTSNKPVRILAALCMHPIGFYEGSWSGAMTPTDDVVAHLMLMRGDEHCFWKRANQHSPGRPEAGL
jgi:hypothetical protein